MQWREYVKSIGMTEDQIKVFESWPADVLQRAFEKPIADLAAATAARDEAIKAKTDFETFYQDEALPKISKVYQDAINERTRATALEARLKAAKEYGFLADDIDIPGTPPPVKPNEVPGSPGSVPAFDASKYVTTELFKNGIDSVPEMLAKLTDISNEHLFLYKEPLRDMNGLMAKARASKKNIREIWETDFNVAAKRKELEDAKQAAHDKQIADAAVQKYASEHGHPFTMPNRPSIASKFTSQGSADSRHPWKGAAERKAERAQKFVQAVQSTGSA